MMRPLLTGIAAVAACVGLSFGMIPQPPAAPELQLPMLEPAPTIERDGYSVTRYLPCATEDSVGCYWDAQHRGNGVGDSFTALPDGTIIYW